MLMTLCLRRLVGRARRRAFGLTMCVIANGPSHLSSNLLMSGTE